MSIPAGNRTIFGWLVLGLFAALSLLSRFERKVDWEKEFS
jgi:hypothetical protein